MNNLQIGQSVFILWPSDRSPDGLGWEPGVLMKHPEDEALQFVILVDGRYYWRCRENIRTANEHARLCLVQ